MIVVYLFIAMLGAAVALFAVQNPTPTAVSFFHWRSAALPVSLLMLLSALVGVLLTAMGAFADSLRLSRKNRFLERELARERRRAEYFEPAFTSRRHIEETPAATPEHTRA